ncbi:MAG: hypothetical protein KAT00_13065 [Planctomycetes bacterium]|nr:hypothetical protein [Planctomycetota bacterium]
MRDTQLGRREFLRYSAVGIALTKMPLYGANLVSNRDRFGGWIGKKFKPTGFFRVEKDKRWWLVTPEGNAFLSFGINHLYPDLWKQDYNRQAWQKRLGVDDLNTPQFAPALRAWFLRTCREYGFNTVGVHTALPIVNTPKPVMPYMLPIRFVDIPHWKDEIPDSNFRDVFSEAFARHCDKMARQLTSPVRDDPFLLGYAMTDCPLFTEEDCRQRPDVIGGARRKSRIGWPCRLRNLGAEAPGKVAYVQTMRDIYRGSIRDFNATYGTIFDSFDTLKRAENWRLHTDLSNGNETRDNVEFLKNVVAKYYKTARDAIRRYDTNHLFVGDKINANTDTMDTVLPVTSQFTDVVFYQMYARYEVQKPGLDRWSKITDKPIINGDSSYTMITDHMPRPYGPVADNVQQRAEWTEEFFRHAFARPEFVGWHYCGLIDAPNLIARKTGRQHSGLINGYGVPYPELKEVVRACADEIYNIAGSEL